MKALLIIDVQAGLCEGKYKAFDVEGLIERINLVSQRARAAGLPVVLVQHEEKDEGFIYGSADWQLGEGLVTADDDLHLRKTFGNAFKETRLHEMLQDLGVSELIVCGMQSDFCVDATVHGAVALGYYAVTLIADGHSTLDAEGLTAAQIIAQRNEALSQLTGVSLRTVDEVLRGGA